MDIVLVLVLLFQFSLPCSTMPVVLPIGNNVSSNDQSLALPLRWGVLTSRNESSNLTPNSEATEPSAIFCVFVVGILFIACLIGFFLWKCNRKGDSFRTPERISIPLTLQTHRRANINRKEMDTSGSPKTRPGKEIRDRLEVARSFIIPDGATQKVKEEDN